MPVVTTRPRALAASAGRGPGRGLRTFADAREIPFGYGMSLINTSSMFEATVAQSGYCPAIGSFRPATPTVLGTGV